VDLIVADGCDLPFESGSFDACIMNGFLTMLDRSDRREAAIREAWRVLIPGGYLYIADFLQTWSDPNYAERYRTHFPVTGEMGTFLVTEDASIDGKVLYRARHHTVEELIGSIENDFKLLSISRTTFRSFHGNQVEGLILLCSRTG
jgi:ubiquinone/menaquinone biosynthesis C-methylase UbiE